MEKTSDTETAARKRAEAKMARILGAIFGGLIVAMIAGMLAFDMYGEKMDGNGVYKAPADAADR